MSSRFFAADSLRSSSISPPSSISSSSSSPSAGKPSGSHPAAPPTDSENRGSSPSSSSSSEPGVSVGGSGEETGAGEEWCSGVGASASGGVGGRGEEMGAGEEWGSGLGASAWDGVGGRGEGFGGGEGLGARVSPPGNACSCGGDGGCGGGEPAVRLAVEATVVVVVVWEENFLSRLRRRGGETAGDAGRTRSSASSKGSVSMMPRLGLSSSRRDRGGSQMGTGEEKETDPREGAREKGAFTRTPPGTGSSGAATVEDPIAIPADVGSEDSCR
nr:unnamed protein product [Digitaria exilis]